MVERRPSVDAPDVLDHGRPGRTIRIVTPDAKFLDGVIDDMARFCSTAAAVNGTANAPLSGGKDSRMLAALFMTRGVPVRYWTKGDESSLDVQIATEIARRYHLPHHVANRPTVPARSAGRADGCNRDAVGGPEYQASSPRQMASPAS